jgi:hypothetical protein
VNAAEVSQSAKKMLNSGRAKSVLSDFARQRR